MMWHVAHIGLPVLDPGNSRLLWHRPIWATCHIM